MGKDIDINSMDLNNNSASRSRKRKSILNSNSNNVKLSNAATVKIDKWLTKFPSNQKKSAIIHTLKVVQEENGGWLDNNLIEAVAHYLDVPPILAMEVATFYNMFELKKVGCYKVSVCTNVSCMLCDCKKIVDHIKNKLDIDFGETTKDNKFTLKEVECLGACGNSPVMMIQDKYYENLTIEKVDEILKEYELE